eukprot:scaffold66062_cov15-Prasinocladus_malaysianus.AAC.1
MGKQVELLPDRQAEVRLAPFTQWVASGHIYVCTVRILIETWAGISRSFFRVLEVVRMSEH